MRYFYDTAAVQCSCGWLWVFPYKHLALPRLHHGRHLNFPKYRPLRRPWKEVLD